MDRRPAFKSWCATLYQYRCFQYLNLSEPAIPSPTHVAPPTPPFRIPIRHNQPNPPQGMNQARALGHAWYATRRTPIHKIYASDLKRAHATAAQLAAPRAALPPAHALACPAVRTEPLLREQHFGAAEGKRWADGHPARTKARTQANPQTQTGAQTQTLLTGARDAEVGPETQEGEVYVTIRNRHDKFPGGESLDDLARRAEAAVDALLWPHLDDARAYYDARNADANTSAGAGAGAVNGDGEDEDGEGEGEEQLGYHVVVVSHGLCISELVAAVLRRSADPAAGVGIRFRGLVNTGWTRLQIRPLVSRPSPSSSSADASERGIVRRKIVRGIFRSSPSTKHPILFLW